MVWVLGKINNHTTRKSGTKGCNGVNLANPGIHTILFVLREKSSGVDSRKIEFTHHSVLKH